MLPKTAGRPLWFPWRGAFSRAGLLAAGCVVALALLAGDAFAGQTPVQLGTADGFAVLGGQTVTNAGFSTLNGDLGVSPGSSLTGFPPGIVNGTQHSADPVAARAQADLTAAYNDAAGRQPPQALPADVGGETLAPGVYKTGATPALGVTGTLTLDGQGDPNAVFVIQVGSALTTAVNSHVNLIGGAQPGNVFWQIGSSATLGTSSVFAGTILALTSISMNDGVTLNGRALARNGAVTLIRDTINVPHRDTINVPHRAKPPRRKLISWSIGQYYQAPRARFLGALETRPAARALGNTLSKLGYENHTRLEGREPHAILHDAPAASVIAIFNHAAAGVMLTRGRGTNLCKTEGLVASGKFTFACTQNRYPGLGFLSPSALAQTRLMIFGGCHTAETHPKFGNLMRTAKKLGVRSVIGFRGLIYYPTRPGPRANGGGNYFWARFATHSGRGSTIGTALRLASRDLLQLSGRTDGYNNSFIDGASPRPANLRLKLTEANAASAADARTLLRSRDGDVLAFSAPASTKGPRRVAVAGARSVATRFLARKAPRIAGAGLTVVSESRATHRPGETLARFTYRSRVAGIPGPAVAEVEVDLRSGKVVSEAAAQRTPASTRFALGRRGALAAARRATLNKRASVVSARKDVWRYPRWTVKLKAPSGASTVVEINARNAHVVSVNSADPSS